MNDEQYIKLAIEEAKKSVEAGGAPIGAVMVKNGRMDSGQWMNMSAMPILLKHKSAQHSVHLTCGTLRHFQALSWLRIFSGSQTQSQPAHLRLTPAVGRKGTGKN